jgi:hypothetical protein
MKWKIQKGETILDLLELHIFCWFAYLFCFIHVLELHHWGVILLAIFCTYWFLFVYCFFHVVLIWLVCLFCFLVLQHEYLKNNQVNGVLIWFFSCFLVLQHEYLKINKVNRVLLKLWEWICLSSLLVLNWRSWGQGVKCWKLCESSVSFVLYSWSLNV